jgi:hypothetical protein
MTSRLPWPRRPPPCGRDGASGTTRWNKPHSPSVISLSTFPATAIEPGQVRTHDGESGRRVLLLTEELATT